MLTTNPEYNRPHKYICAKCGKEYMETAFTNIHYQRNGEQHYPYANANDLDDMFLVLDWVPLCDSCAEEELKANHVREHFLMY